MGRRRSSPTAAGFVRETAPEYGLTANATAVFQVSLGERGRLVLPAEIRERLGIRQGDPLALILEEDGTVSIKTRTVALNDLQGSFKHLAPRDHHASDDLIAARRREARLEDRRLADRAGRRPRRTPGRG